MTSILATSNCYMEIDTPNFNILVKRCMSLLVHVLFVCLFFSNKYHALMPLCNLICYSRVIPPIKSSLHTFSPVGL